MAGLLYKDFIGIKGKRIAWILTGFTALFLILRLAFLENELSDFFLMMPPLLFAVCGITLPSAWTAAICRNDERSKTRQFTGALPLDKNAYIVSKYIFIGIAVYILFSLETLWIIIFMSVAGDNRAREVLAAISPFLMMLYGASLLLASIELPFYLTFGVKRGSVLKIAIAEGAAFFAIAYLFFGDLKIFKNFDIYVFVNWCERHLVVVTLISVLLPVADIFLFWISCRIACRINQNREVEFYG